MAYHFSHFGKVLGTNSLRHFDKRHICNCLSMGFWPGRRNKSKLSNIREFRHVFVGPLDFLGTLYNFVFSNKFSNNWKFLLSTNLILVWQPGISYSFLPHNIHNSSSDSQIAYSYTPSYVSSLLPPPNIFLSWVGKHSGSVPSIVVWRDVGRLHVQCCWNNCYSCTGNKTRRLQNNHNTCGERGILLREDSLSVLCLSHFSRINRILKEEIIFISRYQK